MINHFGWHLNYALTEIIIALRGTCLSVEAKRMSALHHMQPYDPTPPSSLREQEIYPMSINQKIVTDLINNKIEFVTTVPCKQLAGALMKSTPPNRLSYPVKQRR